MHSLRRAKSDTSLFLANSSGHDDLTNQDASALSSRIGGLKADYKNASSLSPLRKTSPLLVSSCFCSPACCQRSSESNLNRTLLSLPLMEAIINVAQRFETLGTDEGLEDELLSVLGEAMHDSCSPWSRLMPKPPAVTGPRTSEQYLCALDIAINARKEMNSKKKIAKYWKRLVLQAHPSDGDMPLTPSPSDISDTGISDSLSSSRRDQLEELIKKRAIVASAPFDDMDNFDTIVRTSENDSHSLSVVQVNKDDADSSYYSDRGLDSRGISALPSKSTTMSVNEVDRTLVDSKVDFSPSLSKSLIPSLKRYQTPLSSTALLRQSSDPPTPEVSLKTHSCCKDTKTVQSTKHKMESAVQTKRLLYESLIARPSPSLACRTPPLLTSTPPVTRPASRITGSLLRRVSPKLPYSPSPSPLSRTAFVKPDMKVPHDISSNRRIAQPKSVNRGSKNASLGGKPSSCVPLSGRSLSYY